MDVLTEETHVNVLLQVTDFLIGEPIRIFNFNCVKRKETLLLVYLKDVVLASLVLLVGDVVLIETKASLFLELSESASKGCFIRPLTVSLGEGPHLTLPAFDK